jgi:DNA-binding response OmpR family regulator
MKTLPGLLLLDDDPDMHLLLKQATPPLVQFYAETQSKAAMARLQNSSIDILVLDLNLGNGETGFKFLENLKTSLATLPSLILILTASDEEADEIHAHELGVAAFVRKPLRPQAFRALVEKHLRQIMADDQQITEVGPFRLDRARLKVWVKETQGPQEVMLTVKEFQLLLKLVQRPEQVFTREQLLEDVWGHDGNIQSRTVDTHVSSLRKKLGSAGEGFNSVRGMGYKWSPH